MLNFSEKKIIIHSQLVNYIFLGGDKTDGATLIFLHGWGLDNNIWNNVIKELKPSVKEIYAIDFPGFGKSENPKKTFSTDDYTDIVEEFIKKLDIKNIIILGHSFGARIAVRLSIRIKDKVKKLILINAAGIRSGKIKTKIFRFFTKLSKPIFGSSEKIRKSLYRVAKSDYGFKPEMKKTFVKIVEESDIPLYNNVTTKTLIIWGDYDSITPISSGKKIQKEIKDSELFIIKEAGHMSFIDKPDILVSKIKEFIK